MSKPTIITGLDIGTSAIKMLVAAKTEGDSNIEVIAQATEPSFGVRKGVVIDIEKAVGVLQSLLNRVRTETGQKINSVHVNISGSHIFSMPSRGTVAVSRADRKVSEEDVERVIQQATQTFAAPSKNIEILEVFPKDFIVDGQGGVKEAVGMQGVRLETEVLVLAGFSPYKNNLTQAVLNSDLQILDIIPSPLASSAAVLTPQQKELGVALLDMGAGTTELSVFENGDLIHLAIFPIGSSNITNDIAIGLKIDVDTAEKIKIERGCCIFKGRDKKEKIETDGDEDILVSQKVLVKIIAARVEEIFGEVKKELKKIQKYETLPSGIVLTGGGAKLPKLADFVKKDLKLPCRIGKPTNFTGLEDDLSFAAACGLVLRAASLEDFSGRNAFAAIGGGVGSAIKKLLKNFLP